MNYNKVERTFYSPVGDYDMHCIFPTSELVSISQIEIVTWNNPQCVITWSANTCLMREREICEFPRQGTSYRLPSCVNDTIISRYTVMILTPTNI